jgi:hypothetical protein
MTQKSRKEAFDDSVPDMSDAEISDALKAGRVAIGFRGEPVMLTENEIGFIALKFSVLEGDTQVLLLDQFAARVLHRIIETANNLDWKAENLSAPDMSK